MTQLRDDANEFAGAIDAASRALGLAPLFVEKDYWVTQVLRALNQRHPGWFVFKGGTSLSKGYGLIERFSEDVDILVAPAKDDSARSREQLLLKMTKSVADELGLEWTPVRTPGHGRMAHRADVLVYPRTVRGSALVPMEDRGVLLETGFAGGDWPGEMVSITPVLCGALGIDPADYDDTRAFSIKALHPARTLLEKLSLLHHVATDYGEESSRDQRCGRHYYDIYRLLDHPQSSKHCATGASSTGFCPSWRPSPPSTSVASQLVRAVGTRTARRSHPRLALNCANGSQRATPTPRSSCLRGPAIAGPHSAKFSPKCPSTASFCRHRRLQATRQNGWQHPIGEARRKGQPEQPAHDVLLPIRHDQHGTTSAYGSQSPAASLAAANAADPVSGAIVGLAAATKYHYRLVAANAGGKTTVADHDVNVRIAGAVVDPTDVAIDMRSRAMLA